MTNIPGNELRKERETISGMFNKIAPKYDLLNRVLSLGIDKIWRARLVKDLISKANASSTSRHQSILDIACGTGDLTIALAKKGFSVTGADIAGKMLEIAQKKSFTINPKPEYIIASADDLPFADNYFDAVTIAFGIRNFERRDLALSEIKRVLKKGGYLYILEFATPSNKIWGAIYRLYFLNILPAIGRAVSGDKSAYSYLPESVKAFPQYEKFIAEIDKAGFVSSKYVSLTGGVALLYSAKKM